LSAAVAISGVNCSLFGPSGVGRTAVVNSLANVTGVSTSDITVTKVNCTNSTGQSSARRKLQSYAVSVGYQLIFFAAPENVQSVYSSITNAISASITDASFSTSLQANGLVGAVATSATFSALVTYAPTISPTKLPTLSPLKPSPDHDSDLSAGEIAGIVIGIMVFFIAIAIGMYFYGAAQLERQKNFDETLKWSEDMAQMTDNYIANPGNPERMRRFSDATKEMKEQQKTTGRRTYSEAVRLANEEGEERAGEVDETSRESEVFMTIQKDSLQAPTKNWNKLF